MSLTIDQITKICHQANAALCESLGDFSQAQYEQSPEQQKGSARQGVQFLIDNPKATAKDSHSAWVDYKLDLDWTFGKVKDDVTKVHPCLIEFDQLEPMLQLKDKIFTAICRQCIPFLEKPKPVKKKVPELHPDEIALKMDSKHAN